MCLAIYSSAKRVCVCVGLLEGPARSFIISRPAHTVGLGKQGPNGSLLRPSLFQRHSIRSCCDGGGRRPFPGGVSQLAGHMVLKSFPRGQFMYGILVCSTFALPLSSIVQNGKKEQAPLPGVMLGCRRGPSEACSLIMFCCVCVVLVLALFTLIAFGFFTS